ncbi:MAG TPA: hypothetical protein DEV85_04205 [Vibrio sp.]|uniref:DUF945 family protein n=1 Tax=Vibrio sp. TaxID=678 RepID=UPI000EBA70A9|nr:DUF945 family protein [Vibrio sp.]HCH01080.1 hypothetical protein [Vibrio sp.]
MNNVKKFVAIGGAVLLGACWPLALGQFAQTTIQDTVNKLDKEEVNVELVNYDRGYLSSTAQTKVTVVDPVLKQQLELDGLPTEFLLDHTISHGLVSIATDTKPNDYTSLPIDIHSVTYINGSTALDMTSQKMAFNFANDVNSKLEFSPAKLSADISRDGHIKFDYAFEGLDGHFSNGESLIVDSVTGAGNGQKKEGFWLGSQQITVGETNMVDVQGVSIVDVHKFDYEFNTEENTKEKTFSSHHKIAVDTVDLVDDTLTDLGVDASFNSLDIEAFSQLLSVYQDKGHALNNDDIKVIMASVDGLFEKGFSISLNEMKASIGEGKFNSDWLLNFPKGDNKVTKNPMQVISSINGGANAFISTEMVTQFPFIQSGLDDLIQQGIMVKQADGYHLNGDIKGGNIVFKGGKTLPLFVVLAPLFL